MNNQRKLKQIASCTRLMAMYDKPNYLGGNEKMSTKCNLVVSVLWVTLLCSACAPVWPRLSDDVDASGGLRGSDSDVSLSIDYALETRRELSNSLDNSLDFRRGWVYSLFGLGTASGVGAVFDVSNTALKGLAIGSAAVLGTGELFGASQQILIYSAGIDAVDCAIDATRALTRAEVGVSATAIQSITMDANSFVATATSDLSALQTTISQAVSPDARMLAGQQLAIASVAVAEINELALLAAANRAATVDLQVSTQLAASQAASELRRAILKIKKTIKLELDKSLPDPRTVFDTQRQLISDSIGEVNQNIDKTKDTKKDMDDAINDAPDPNALTSSGFSNASNLVQSIQTIRGESIVQSQITRDILSDTSAVENVFDACVSSLVTNQDE